MTTRTSSSSLLSLRPSAACRPRRIRGAGPAPLAATTADKIGVTEVGWPKQYRSAKTQLERNLEREKQAAAQVAGLSPLEQANRALGV